jgi:hypothetical protein
MQNESNMATSTRIWKQAHKIYMPDDLIDPKRCNPWHSKRN